MPHAASVEARDAVDLFLGQAAAWAGAEPGIAVLLLVGSHARGTPRPDSDVDLVVVCAGEADRERLLSKPEAFARFGRILGSRVERYGACTSLRVTYDGGLEVEFGFVTPPWILSEPMDAGTRRVLADGFRLLFDRNGWESRIAGTRGADR
jgi:uncharacterized protein